MSIHGDIQGDWRVPSSRTYFNDRMNFLCAAVCTASFLIKHVTMLCLVALVYDREDLNCVFGHVDLLAPYKTAQYNRRLQHFLKQILNAMCFLKMRTLIWMFTGYYHSPEEMDQREKEIMHWIGETLKTKCSGRVYYIITFCDLATETMIYYNFLFM